MKRGLITGVIFAGVALPFSIELTVNQTASAQLPPPPPITVPVPSTPPPSRSTPIYPTPAPGERVFTAPSPAGYTSNVGQYRVIVDSGSPTVLQQVRRVRPDAFFQNLGGRRVIQVGVYSDSVNARQQATLLSAQGINAQIVGGDGSSGSATRGYYAVVPGSRQSVREYQYRAIQSGVPRQLIQLRDRPLGTHLAVGPFSDQRDGEQAVQYLRDRVRLDARLFYGR